jgi:delta 1-pyrroline-5-carboxylate dehydrogenase
MVIPPFRNESLTDFTRPEHRQAFQEALARVRARFGTRYPLRIGGEAVTTGETLASHNPAHPDEVVGAHAMAGAAEVEAAVSAATAAFADWSRTPAEQRASNRASAG